ncbi:FliG C-terminal domain-containing protein [Paracoccus marinaquae]|uniref:Flagellar motor switch protein FliG n=1 Tax=Paracoccus marinaquae TaxID=2841926 RepID=A0ABS6AG81_9RHOB|nr:FliG C-terminal domain-containing protein [Paracoccus marinaquae]MBU3029231.1 flagellar motor switch protein FliG [Paracoccus marinaquae]
MMTQTGLSPRQKAAVIVRLLLDDDEAGSLTRLDSEAQTLLAEEMAGMELIDRQTRDAVITEFCDRLAAVGVTFPGDLDGTLAMLGGKLSDDSTDRLRRLAAMSGRGDPWARVAALPKENILALANSESTEIVALMLSKLPVARASEVFFALSRDRARSVAQAMSLTDGIGAAALNRVGLILLHAAEALPRPAIDTPMAGRMGAILNFATADLREEVLESLEQNDAGFADGVRRAIFIFAHIPTRIEPRDVPRIVREVEQPVLIRALSAPDAVDAAAAEFLLSNLSQRMADGLREEMEGLGKLRPRDFDEAKTEVIAAIRRLETEGELTLILPAEDED